MFNNHFFLNLLFIYFELRLKHLFQRNVTNFARKLQKLSLEEPCPLPDL